MTATRQTKEEHFHRDITFIITNPDLKFKQPQSFFLQIFCKLPTSLGEQIFDTNLNKLVICIIADTQKRVDATAIPWIDHFPGKAKSPTGRTLPGTNSLLTNQRADCVTFRGNRCAFRTDSTATAFAYSSTPSGAHVPVAASRPARVLTNVNAAIYRPLSRLK